MFCDIITLTCEIIFAISRSMDKGFFIRAYMKAASVTVQQIADELHLSHGAVSQVIHGVRRTQYIREAIAKAVNKPVSELWQDAPKNEEAA